MAALIVLVDDEVAKTKAILPWPPTKYGRETIRLTHEHTAAAHHRLTLTEQHCCDELPSPSHQIALLNRPSTTGTSLLRVPLTARRRCHHWRISASDRHSPVLNRYRNRKTSRRTPSRTAPPQVSHLHTRATRSFLSVPGRPEAASILTRNRVDSPSPCVICESMNERQAPVPRAAASIEFCPRANDLENASAVTDMNSLSHATRADN